MGLWGLFMTHKLDFSVFLLFINYIVQLIPELTAFGLELRKSLSHREMSRDVNNSLLRSLSMKLTRVYINLWRIATVCSRVQQHHQTRQLPITVNTPDFPVFVYFQLFLTVSVTAIETKTSPAFQSWYTFNIIFTRVTVTETKTSRAFQFQIAFSYSEL